MRAHFTPGPPLTPRREGGTRIIVSHLDKCFPACLDLSSNQCAGFDFCGERDEEFRLVWACYIHAESNVGEQVEGTGDCKYWERRPMEWKGLEGPENTGTYCWTTYKYHKKGVLFFFLFLVFMNCK